MDKLRVLVLGDGLLGSELVKQTGWDYISRKKDGFDVNNIYPYFPKNNIQTPIHNVIVNCIANTDTYSLDKDSHWNLNYVFVNKLINYCNRYKIKLVHISTDYVYSQSIENASEEDVPVHCNNWYGYTKLLGDGLVQLMANNYLLIRCTHKPKPFPYDNAWVDQIGNFDYVDVIVNNIVNLIVKNANGLYNVGTETKTIFELASQTNKVGPINAPLHVPHNTSMNISKMQELLAKKPFFSIAIPTYGYNGKGIEFLEHNFEILSRQTFKDFEVVVSDHSIDDTIKTVCDKWKDKINIKYYRNEKGRGFISPNLNVALKNSSGEWIKVLFQDDFLYNENSLQIQHNILRTNPDIKWLITTFYHSVDGVNFHNLYHPKINGNIWQHNMLGNPSNLTILNKDLLFFDEELNWFMDGEYYKRLYLKHGNPTIINDITVVNRTHGGGLTDNTPQSVMDKELKILTERYA